ncbi:hypothetical protein HYX13_02580 [Candidatus Woesearchaeota archaeon]|nr:hypothetical protein [Candidatus Woesearchaeota archaeon]
MNEWLKKQLKSGAKAILTVAILNQLLYPPFAAKRLSEWVAADMPEKIDVPAVEYSEDNINWGAQEYLTYAHSLVWKHHNEKEHNCNHLSDATFDTYYRLIFLQSREELEDKVRYASLPLEKPKGHMWLEIYDEEEKRWIPFETRNKTPPLLLEEVKKYVQSDKEYRKDIVSVGKAEFFTLPGKVFEREIFYPTFHPFFYPGGLLRVMWKEYRGDFEIKE